MQTTPSYQERAKAFLFEHGRPLEQALYAYHFENGTSEAIYTRLARFQHADGGFGYALEPDLRTPDASALATSVALQTLRELHAPADYPLVQGAICYLLATYDAERQRWQIIPPSTNAAPHAPWWNYDAGLAQRFGEYLANPRAEIVGYLYDYADLVPKAMLDTLSRAVVEHLHQQPDAMEMHDLLCYIRLAETTRLPDTVRTSIMQKLMKVVPATVARDPAEWQHYGLPPLSVVHTPDSPFAPMFGREIEANLDFLLTQQEDDGSWTPSWSWAETFPEAWSVAKQEWSGVLTLDNLLTLRSFGRLR
jgi:hypothetical protein